MMKFENEDEYENEKNEIYFVDQEKHLNEKLRSEKEVKISD